MNIQLNENDFKQIIDNNHLVLLDFYADWCGPCNTLSPTISKLAQEFEGEVIIKKVNVDNNKNLASEFGVRSIPTLIYFSNGEEIKRSSGVISEIQLRDELKQLALSI